MSLFKVCSLWAAQCGDCELNYDSNLLHCCRFSANETEKDYIVVGSHSGYLSVFKPNAINDSEFSGFQPTDQLLEMQLDSPIIQLSSGHFTMEQSSTVSRQLAVLHPFKLCVYHLQFTGGFADHGNQFQLKLCFEHRFEISAYNLCHGHFGGYKPREFFCVTHIDSALTLFEQDGIFYESRLSGDRNIPSKMIYNSRIDCFYMVSSFCVLECYRYQDLSELSDSHANKNVLPAWSMCIGEYALDIQIQQISESECIILILCENYLYGISDESSVKFIKRLDYSPKCFNSFVAGWYYEPDARLIITAVSDSGTMLIYNMTQLIWAAQLPDVPIAICRSNLDCLAGAIVMLFENGKVDVSYLGSEPQLFQVPPLNLQKMNFERTQRELLELEKEIKAGIDFSDVTHVNATTEQDLLVEISCGNILESVKFATNLRQPVDEAKMILINVALQANAHLESIQIQFHVENPLKCSKELTSIESLAAGQKSLVDSWIFVDRNFDPASTFVTTIVSFINRQSVPRIIEKKSPLPLAMFYRPHQGQKDVDDKFTISVENVSTPTILDLFENDFSIETMTMNAIGFRSIYSGKIVTIVSGKNSNRFRIQSDSLASIAPVMEVFIERLQQYGKKFAAKSKISIVAMPQLPIASLVKLIDAHFAAFAELQETRKNLQHASTRMRLLERQFFMKLDDKKTDTIVSVSNMLKHTHKDIMKIVQTLQQSSVKLTETQAHLSSGLISFAHAIAAFNISQKTITNLCMILCGATIDNRQQCWEEMVAPAFESMHRFGFLSKNKTNDVSVVGDIDPFEFNRFKRHFVGVLERLCRLCIRSSNAADADESTDNNLKDELNEEDEQMTNIDTAPEESEWTCNVEKTMEMLPRL